MTSYAAALAMHVAIRGAECTADQPRCAPLFFAQDVVLAPWNVVQLLKMTNEQPDPDPKVVQRRTYTIHEPRSAGVLPPDMVSLAQYAVGQQVALYSHLEAWRISIDRYRTASAISAEDEQAARDDLRGNGFGPDLQAWFSDSPAWASLSTRAANPSSTQSPSPPPWRQKYRGRVLSTSEKRSNHFVRGQRFCPRIRTVWKLL